MSSRKIRIDKLRNLVDELSDRDAQLKNDAKLFEEFFANFPIPVTMWSLDATGNVISKRGNTVINQSATGLGNLFHEEYSDDFKDAHKRAYSGKNVAFFSNLPNKTYYTRLVPRWSENSVVVGITGVSWDITGNFEILKILSEIKEMTVGKQGILGEIYKLSEGAIEKSRIKKLLAGVKDGE